MIKALAIICVILALGWGVTYLGYSHRGEKINALTAANSRLIGNNIFLEASIEERNKKAKETSERIQSLENAVKKDKTGFDWNADISSSPIVIQLRKD